MTTEVTRNQCDGCCTGLPINANNNHEDNGVPVMGCTAHLYASHEIATLKARIAVLEADLAETEEVLRWTRNDLDYAENAAYDANDRADNAEAQLASIRDAFKA